MNRLRPLPRAACPADFDALFALTEQVMGFVPNSLLIMARDPDLLAAFAQLSAVVVLRPGRVDAGLKALVMQVASEAAGCRYCTAHSANLAAQRGVAAEKVAAVWEYEENPLFSDLERAVLRLAHGAARNPTELSEADFTAVRRFLDEEQVLEIVAVIAFMGFLNRWNDTLSTPLEWAPRAFAERHLAVSGWNVGQHGETAAAPPSTLRSRPLRVRLVMWLLKRWAPRPRYLPAAPVLTPRRR
jgi:uncharacterized peroxidase-related enzyme